MLDIFVCLRIPMLHLLSPQNNLSNLILPPRPTEPVHLSVFVISTVRTDWLIAAVRTNRRDKMWLGCFYIQGTEASVTSAEETSSQQLHQDAETDWLCIPCVCLSCFGQRCPLCWNTGVFCVAKRAKCVLQPDAVCRPSSFDKFGADTLPVHTLDSFYWFNSVIFLSSLWVFVL